MRKGEQKRQDTIHRAIAQQALLEIPDNASQCCQQCNDVGRACAKIIRFADGGL